ncbi:MAG: FkbM family methyltransferase [Opitutaceae bacterium]|nr:FkbM family methyltransferase [Opitutaceae bacterium]
MAETLRSRVQQTVNRLLHPLGLHLARRDRVFNMSGLLTRAKLRGLAPATVIDVGASDGIWSLRARRHFPAAQFLLFEPLAERQPALQQLQKRHGFAIEPAVAGAAAGQAAFNVDPALDGSGVATAGTAGTRTVPQTTVDHAVDARNLRGPYMLKLDTHGYEIPVLDGATRVIAETELLIIEAYNFTLTPDCLRFHELCAWLESRGFRCCDLADPMRRPGDGVLWQMDLAFAPKDHPMFATNGYR